MRDYIEAIYQGYEPVWEVDYQLDVDYTNLVDSWKLWDIL